MNKMLGGILALAIGFSSVVSAEGYVAKAKGYAMAPVKNWDVTLEALVGAAAAKVAYDAHKQIADLDATGTKRGVAVAAADVKPATRRLAFVPFLGNVKAFSFLGKELTRKGLVRARAIAAGIAGFVALHLGVWKAAGVGAKVSAKRGDWFTRNASYNATAKANADAKKAAEGTLATEIIAWEARRDAAIAKDADNRTEATFIAADTDANAKPVIGDFATADLPKDRPNFLARLLAKEA